MTRSADSLADAIDRAIERDRMVRDETIDHTLSQGERLTAALSQRQTVLDPDPTVSGPIPAASLGHL
jgi:hypothetical protein